MKMFNIVQDGVCEFCGELKPWLASGTHFGVYCIECIREVRDESTVALKEIRAEKKTIS